MAGLDERIAGLGGHGLLVVVAVAILIGLRHATDPDHLTAVSTLIASDDERGTRRAGRLGLSGAVTPPVRVRPAGGARSAPWSPCRTRPEP